MRSAVIHAPADQEMGAADFAAGRPTPDAEAHAGLVCAALRAMNRALEDAGLDRQMKSEVLGDVGACLSCPWWCSEAAAIRADTALEEQEAAEKKKEFTVTAKRALSLSGYGQERSRSGRITSSRSN